MGSCFTVIATEPTVYDQTTAKVVTSNGCLKEYYTPVSVRQVLGSDSVSCFLCNSDSLNYNGYISTLDLNEMVQLGQLYFILPVENLKSPLSGEDMAALAIKASLIIQAMPINEADELEAYKRMNEFSVSNMSTKVAGKKMGSSVHSSLSRERLSTIAEVSRL